MLTKILLLENIHPSAQKILSSANVQVDLEIGSLSEEELLKRLPDYSMVGIRSKTQLTEKVLNQNPHLLAVGCFCIGTNQVDLITATKKGIPVFNAPYSNTRSVAELIIAEIISLSRNLFDSSKLAHQGIWNKSAKGSREVRGKKLGIIGYGHIGSQVSVLAEAMGLDVHYYDIVTKLPLGNATAVDSLDELLGLSDFVTLHVPETPETKNMIGKRELAKMKPGSYLLNASRGSVVVIDDLVSALKEMHLAGAAVDVFPVEPKNNEQEFVSPLRDMNNVILTPHIGGSTEEAQANIGQEVALSLLGYLLQGKSYGAVQFPNVDVPHLKENVHRLMNVHKNVPGVLGEINSIVSAKGVNIQAQYLSTNPDIGYLVMDLEAAKEAEEVSDLVSKLSTSLTTRLI